MTRGKTAKTKKKFKPKNFSQTVEPPKIQKRNKEKYSKNKVRNDARKAAARKIVLEELTRKKAIESGKGTLFDGVTMDLFLETGAGEPMGEVVPTPAMEATNGPASEEKDCSFYEFLKRVDRDLAELDTDELVEDEDYITEVTREGGLTSRILSTWEPQLSEDKSLGILKKTLLALKSAAHAAGTKSENRGTKVVPVDSKVFDRVVELAYKQTPNVIIHHVPLTEKNGRIQAPAQDKNLTETIPLLRSLFHTTLVLLPTLSSASTTLLVLSQTEKLVPYITGFRKLIKQLIASVLDIWSRRVRPADGKNAEPEDTEQVKKAALMWIKKVTFVGDRSLKDICLTDSYAAFVKNARITTSRTLPHLKFLKSSLSELYGSFQNTSHQHAFTYIRQLAIHLRNALTTQTPESQLVVYNWQYIHSLDFFSTMLGQHVGDKKDSPLHPLVYPIMQVILGTIKLDPSSQNFPLRFYLTGSLLRLSKETGVHVDLAPTLLEPLDSAVMTIAHPKKTSDKAIKAVDFDVTLRVPSSYLSGPPARIYRDQVASKVESSLVQYFDLHALNPAFPETVTVALSVIKEWVDKIGENCGSKVRRVLNELAGKLEEHAKWVEEKRDGMEFSTENLQKNQVIADGEGAPLREWMKTHNS